MGLSQATQTLLQANNKGVDQPAHLRSLISAYVLHSLVNDSWTGYLPNFNILASLVYVAEQVSLSLTWLPTLKQCLNVAWVPVWSCFLFFFRCLVKNVNINQN